MKPTPQRKKKAKRIFLVGCLLLLAVIVAALVNPLIVKVPLKMLMGKGGLMRHMATVHATLDGTDIEYDVFGGRTTHAAGWSGTELVLISKSPQTVTNAHGFPGTPRSERQHIVSKRFEISGTPLWILSHDLSRRNRGHIGKGWMF